MISNLHPDLALRTSDLAPPNPVIWSNTLRLLHDLKEILYRPPPTDSVAEWVAANVHFNEPAIRGPFDFTGRCYLKQPLEDTNNPAIYKQTRVMGTGTGKTISDIASALWEIHYLALRTLWIFPALKGAAGASNFAKTRLISAIHATAALTPLIPRDRHAINSQHIQVGGSIIDLAGASSTGQLKQNRCNRVRLDEMDSYPAPETIGNDAGPAQLAETRTDGVHDAKIFESSTPTLETGPIWQSLMRSNLNRRFLPCPGCNPSATGTPSDPSATSDLRGWFILVWSQQFHVLPDKFPNGELIPTAQIRWDKEAKRKDGSWDIDRVVRSARAECPHCHYHLQDAKMNWCDQHGLWLPTRTTTSTNQHVGYHLSRLYAARNEFKSTFGGIARKFLDDTQKGELKDFKNSVLAEVDVSQEHSRIEIITNATPLSREEWIRLASVDVQKKWPYLWLVIRDWSITKLDPPFPLQDGGPTPETLKTIQANPDLWKLVETIVGKVGPVRPAWIPVLELLRFNNQRNSWPLLEWCVAQKITGEKLVKIYREHCASNTLDLGKYIFHQITGTTARLPKAGDSELILAGHAEDWEDLRQITTQYQAGRGLKYPRNGVLIDSGFGADDNKEVLRESFASATQFAYYNPLHPKSSHEPNTVALWPEPQPGFKPVPLDGWTPYKGYPQTKRKSISGITYQWWERPADPFDGTSEMNETIIRVLEAPSDHYWHQLQDLRERQTPAHINRGGNIFAVSPNVVWLPEDGSPAFRGQVDYQKQMDARYRDRETREIRERGGGGGTGTRLWPDHLNDCERNMRVLATRLGIFSSNEK